MKIPYYIFNNLRILKKLKSFDPYISFTYEILESEKFYFEVGYIEYKTQSELTEIKIDSESNQLTCLNVVSCKRMFFLTSELHFAKLINYHSSVAISCDVDLRWDPNQTRFYIPCYTIPKHATLLIYTNAITLYLPGAGSPKYFIKESEEFGAIVDKDFNIIAFVVSGITIEEIALLKEYAQRNPMIESLELPQELNNIERNVSMMKNKEELMRRILALENVVYWELVYFGLERALIDESFIGAFACEYLASEKMPQNDTVTLEIAGLLNNEQEKAMGLLKKFIQNPDSVLIEKGRFYNKIWLFLSLAIDMRELKIIE